MLLKISILRQTLSPAVSPHAGGCVFELYSECVQAGQMARFNVVQRQDGEYITLLIRPLAPAETAVAVRAKQKGGRKPKISERRKNHRRKQSKGGSADQPQQLQQQQQQTQQKEQQGQQQPQQASGSSISSWCKPAAATCSSRSNGSRFQPAAAVYCNSSSMCSW